MTKLENNEFITHSVHIPGRPTVTVGGVVKPDEHGIMSIYYGVSRCSEKDQFIKRLGVSRAIGRARSQWQYALCQQVGEIANEKYFKEFITTANKLIQDQGCYVRKPNKK